MRCSTPRALDDCHARRIAVAAAPAIEHVAHGKNGLEGVSLRASRRRDIGLAARHPDGVVENRLDGLGVDPASVVLNDDRVLLDDDRDRRAATSASSQASSPLSMSSLATTNGHS